MAVIERPASPQGVVAISAADILAIELAMAADEEPPPVDPATAQLVETAEAGDEAALRELLDDGTPVDGVGRAGTTALMEASAGGHAGSARQLLERGASTACADGIGWTSLHFAAYNGNLACAEALLEAGGDDLAKARCVGDAPGSPGQTALDLALEGCADLGAAPRRRRDSHAVAVHLLRATLPPARADETIALLPEIAPEPPADDEDADRSDASEEDYADGDEDDEEAAAMAAELEALEQELAQEEMEAELLQQELDAEEALAAAELEELQYEAREAEAEAAAVAAAAASLQEIVPDGFQMESFYALPEPSAEQDRSTVWAEPALAGFYSSGREVRCRDDDALLAAVAPFAFSSESYGGAQQPLRRLIISSLTRVTTQGLQAFAAEARRLQETGALPHTLEIIADGSGPWFDGELAAFRGIALSKLDISGVRGIDADDVASLAAGIRRLQSQGVMGRDFELIARGCDWGGPTGSEEILTALSGIAFGKIDLSRFKGVTDRSLARFARGVAGMQQRGEMGAGLVLTAKYCDWSGGLLAALGGVALASLDISGAENLSAEAIAGFQSATSALQQPALSEGGGVRMGLGFALVVRSHEWEAGELASLCDAHEDMMDLDLGRLLDKEYTKEPLVDGPSGRAVGMSMGLLDISGGTSLRHREVGRLTASLRLTQEHIHTAEQGQLPRMVLKATDCDWGGGLLEPWGDVALSSLDISDGVGMTLGDVHAFGARAVATQQRLLDWNAAGERQMELVARNCERMASAVDWTLEEPDGSPLVSAPPVVTAGGEPPPAISGGDSGGDRSGAILSLEEFLTQKGMEKWLEPLRTHMHVHTAAALKGLEVSDLQRLALLSGWQLLVAPTNKAVAGATRQLVYDGRAEQEYQRGAQPSTLGVETDPSVVDQIAMGTSGMMKGFETQRETQMEHQKIRLAAGVDEDLSADANGRWGPKSRPQMKPARVGSPVSGGGESNSPVAAASLEEQILDLERQMKDATDAGDDRLEPLAKIWGWLAHPTGAKASQKWNWFTMAELRRIHSVLTDQDGREVEADEAGDEVAVLSLVAVGGEGERQGNWVRRALSRNEIALSRLDTSPTPTQASSGGGCFSMNGSNGLRRAIKFERQSIGQELSIAFALGILPGGVEAIQGRKGAQATQGSAAPGAQNVRTWTGE